MYQDYDADEEQIEKPRNKSALTIALVLFIVCAIAGWSAFGYSYVKGNDERLQSQSEINNLRGTITKLHGPSTFMDNYVVIVSADGSGLYHKYGCSSLDLTSFWIFNTEAAEQKGYDPCPTCISGTNQTLNNYSGNPIVYVTDTGSKYHNQGCSYLNSSNPITLSEAKAQGYTPCSRCKPPN